MVTIEDIYEAYADCRKNKRATNNALAFEIEYPKLLHDLWESINNRTYEIGKSICFVVTKPKQREVFAADFRDRIVHHLVIRKIEPLLESAFIDDTYNCRIGKGVEFGVNRLRQKIDSITEHYTKDAWAGKFDCKGFFMSIDKILLRNKILDCIQKNYYAPDKDDIMWLLEKIVLHSPNLNCEKRSNDRMWEGLPADKSLFTCGKNVGLPIGNLSSQVLANFYLSDFDKWMMKKFHGYYGRYVDDFFVLSNNKDEILRSINEIRDNLAQLHITLHPKKIYVQHYSKGIKFIGAVLKFDRIYAGNSTVHNLSECIDELNNVKDKENYTNCAMQRMNSYLGFLSHRASYGIRVRLLNKLAKGWSKYVYISGSHQKILLRVKHKTAF